METKSRYEVISDLEVQKREHIKEENGFANELKAKNDALKDVERQKSDQMIAWDRKIEDVNADLEHFKATQKERKETVTELIVSINESLARFGELVKPAK